MSNIISSDKKRLVIGLGKTGYSCVRFFVGQNIKADVLDTRAQPPYLSQCHHEFPDVKVFSEELTLERLSQYQQLVVSPGIAISHPAIQEAIKLGVDVVGDIDIFSQYRKAPLVAITGSNAKSTVTELLGFLAKSQGVKVAIGGNLGEPALDLLSDDVELYVLELSSFQLETTAKLCADVATILNVSEDHLDRYDGMAGYHKAKQRIFIGSKRVVINDDDKLTSTLLNKNQKAYYFSSKRQDLGWYSLKNVEGEPHLMQGFKSLMPAKDTGLFGGHNYINALSALALGEAAGLNLEKMLQAFSGFVGLKHRCQQIAIKNGVTFVNDSKGTNVGATVAALEGLSANDKKVHLLAGGVGKDADFSLLQPSLSRSTKKMYVFGKDAQQIAAVANATPVEFCESLEEAVKKASQQASDGDYVLLSPACASFDMFDNFEHRGDCFIDLVEAMND